MANPCQHPLSGVGRGPCPLEQKGRNGTGGSFAYVKLPSIAPTGVCVCKWLAEAISKHSL